MIHNELITTINSRATAHELISLTKLTFWEKFGLTKVTKTKKTMMLYQGKEKLDESYIWFRNTIIQSIS